MKIDVKILGKIERIRQTSDSVTVKGVIDQIGFASKHCDTENWLMLKEPYYGVVVEGLDLTVKEHRNDKVIVNGEIINIKLLDKKGNVAREFSVEVCCIRLNEVKRDEEPDYKVDIDLGELEPEFNEDYLV